MAVIGDPLHVVQLHLRQHAALLAQPGVRVGAQQQAGARVVTPRRRDHRLKILSGCERAGNGEISRHLVNEQHLRARIVVQAGCQRIGEPAVCGVTVVLGDAQAQQFAGQRFRPRHHFCIAGRSDQLLKAAGLASVVVNSHRIGDQGDGLAPSGGVANITDKAIFQLPVRQPAFMGLLFDLSGIGFLAPADQDIVLRQLHAGLEGV